MNPDECRKAFEAKMARDYPNTSLAWDMDYNEYVFDEANHMYSGFALAWNSRTESKPVTRDDDGSVTVAGRRYAQWPNNSWRGTPAQAVEAYEADAEMVPACAYDAALADRNALIRLLAQLSAPQSPVVPGVEELDDVVDQAEKTWTLSGASKLGPKSTFIASRVHARLLATGGRESREDRYREALERIARPVRNDYEELADIAREALATINAKEPS